MATPARAVVLLSGGLDSAVAAAMALHERRAVEAITIDYGQRAAKAELRAASTVAEALGIADRRLSLRPPWPESGLISRSRSTPLLSDRAQVFLPGRNLFLLSAVAAATSCEADIYVGTNRQDAYSDATTIFFDRFSQLLQSSGNRSGSVQVRAPLASSTKTEVIATGLSLDVPLHLTWSCYERGPRPCHRCVACRTRARAFEELGVCDPALASHRPGAAATRRQTSWRSIPHFVRTHYHPDAVETAWHRAYVRTFRR